MYARRTESLDASEIESLITPISMEIFGKPNLINVIEKSLLSVTLLSKSNEIVGYASFFDFPRIPGIDSGDEWNEIVNLKQYPLANSLNSFFIHYFLAKIENMSSIMVEIINTVLNTAPNIHYIFLNSNKPSLPDSLNSHFKSLGFCWYGLKRESYMPTLYIRLAKPEDMDDLSPIFNNQSKILHQLYGEFYLAEMIAAQNENTKCLAAEVGGIAVGFMSVTTEMNVEILNYGFYVEPFEGFKKPDYSTQEEKDTSLSDNKNTNLPSGSTEYSVPVTIPKDVFESSLSETEVEKSTSLSYSHFQFPSKMSGKALQNIDWKSVSQYGGVANAIMIQLFAINEIYEMRSFDFIEHVFKLFPTKDYLLITMPYLVPEFPLLDNFVRVSQRPGIISPHELYVFHKGSLISNFRVRQTCLSDQQGIEKLIANMKFNNYLLNDLDLFHKNRRLKNGVNLYSYVAECMDQIVGIAILNQEEDIEYIRSHYNIEDFIYFTHHKRDGHGHIKHFAVNPIFKRLTKCFLKEIMRKSEKTSLYYPVYKPWASETVLREHTLVTNLPDLVSVRPRRQIMYDLVKLEGNAPTDRVLQEQEGYCLTHFNRKLTMEPKITINARIVVVGASTTGLSFLESLVFCPHLKFNNLYLISPNGLPDYYAHEEMVEQLMGRDFYFSKKKLELSALRIQVNVVKGYMTTIDRKKKQIMIDNKYILAYDHMIITTGLQYSIPCPTEAEHYDQQVPTGETQNRLSRRYSELKFKKHQEKIVSANMFAINDPFDAVRLLDFIKTNLLNNDSRIIIYGHSFEAYCCLHTILSMGVYGYRIHFIKPPTEEDNYPINNHVVEEAVYRTLSEAGVSIHDNYGLAKLNDSDEVPYWIHSATFTSHGSSMRLDCQAFISYYQKVVDYTAFRAMNDSCLVFDSRLVIDNLFFTNDKYIRAAGPVTKFQRRYYSDQWNHSKFNSKVVGDELSKVFLRLFDPTLFFESSAPPEDIPLIPMYDDPILKSCILPGGYLYLNVSKPTISMNLSALISQPNYGTVFTTGNPYSDEGYFRLHINQYKKVETITCLRKKHYSIENLIQLYGIHEKALNNLESRFNENLIKDFFEFFTDCWAMVFYHDRFKDLKNEIKELLMTRTTVCKMSFEETVRSMMADDTELSREQKNELMKEFVDSNAKTTVDRRLINFITYNYYHLPMYALPDMV